MAAFSWLAVQNNYEISEYILEPDAFMQRLLVQILFVFFIIISKKYWILNFKVNL